MASKSDRYYQVRDKAKEARQGIEYLSPNMIEWLRLIEDLKLATIDCDRRALNALARRDIIAPSEHRKAIRITKKGFAHLKFYG